MAQVEELVKEIQKGLLQWYDFRPGSTILYFGKEEEVYAAVLKKSAGRFISVSIESIENKDWQTKYAGVFDYIVAIEVLERQIEPKSALETWRKLLKSDGILLLGMNNRFGLRYFCGDRDPYTKRNFDGIEDYQRAYSLKEDIFSGRCYNKSEIQEMLQNAGLKKYRFYSVLSDLRNPSLIYAENYLPNEDLCNRIQPTYNYPDTVFLEEAGLYNSLVQNGMFHEMANAYLIECSLDGSFSDVNHVTSSMDRDREKAYLTIIHQFGIVEKRAVYPEGKKGLKRLFSHSQELKAHGIQVVEGKLERDSYIMPYMKCESGLLYLKKLARTDKEKFLQKMDLFRDLIFQSSEIKKPDQGDGQGAILEKGYLDMVPLNSFYKDGTFVFYDQEFSEENYPANVLLYRMISALYAGDLEMCKIIPMEILLERYDLKRELEKWRRMEWEFLAELCQLKKLRIYHEKCRGDYGAIFSNRQRLNYSLEDYQKLFIDIFQDADTHKLILFGSGNFTKRFLSIYRQDYPVYAILDNNEGKWGQKLEGIEIQSPEILRKMRSGEYKVLICIKNYLSVMKQLDAMGVKDYSIYDSNRSYPKKRKPIVQKSELTQVGLEHKKYRTGYVAGVFDMFHIGHVNLLRRAKEQCDYLIVGVVPDEEVCRQKNKMPVIPCEERVEVLRACRYVDQAEALPTDYAGIRDAYRMYQFDCQFSGDDHGDNPGWLADKEFLARNGADIVFLPYTKETSSTEIREKLLK